MGLFDKKKKGRDDFDSPVEQVDLSSQWPIMRNLSGLARWNWSIQDKKLLEGLVGVEYNAGCWQVRAVAHRFITATQQYSTSFQLQLELSGLSRIGINPLTWTNDESSLVLMVDFGTGEATLDDAGISRRIASWHDRRPGRRDGRQSDGASPSDSRKA